MGKVFLAVWGSGCLEFDIKTERWKVYLDPDHEMEIDLYRDDGIIHVITTSVDYCQGALWISTYFGNCRYDGRHWRGYYADETGLPSDFTNGLAARSADEAWLATDKGLGEIADFATDTIVSYRRLPDAPKGTASIYRQGRLIKEVSMPLNVPHNHITCVAVDGNDLWVGTAKGLAWAVGDGYYSGLRPASGDNPSTAYREANDSGE
ncbi:MAG: hypothetical protein D6741_16990 [Planctomycetota bacterium]|nr:MAG: hypothetical protein D6741_16990 [Planctomycetota bacterium]